MRERYDLVRRGQVPMVFPSHDGRDGSLRQDDGPADHRREPPLTRCTWYQTHHWTQPYPGDDQLYLPDDVPGSYVPSADVDG